MESELKSHCTAVVGMDEKGIVVFLKSYDYATQKEECQRDLSIVQEKYHAWLLTRIDRLTISQVYKEALEFAKEIQKDPYLSEYVESAGFDVDALIKNEEWRIENR